MKEHQQTMEELGKSAEEMASAEGRKEERMPQLKGRHRWAKRIALALVLVVVAVGTLLGIAVERRLREESLGIAAVEAPSAPRELEDSSGKTGAFTARVSYTSMAATEGQQVATDVAWDDRWFFQDPTVYNHELATTCSVLSAVANAESAYYQEGSDAPAYMEEALAELGFDDISTASYQYRSEVFDEVVDFLTGTDDVVAYSVATKRITDADGNERTLYLVAIRGSYGSEWLSDLNMGDASNYDMDAIDHEGFMRAAQEIVDDLEQRITEDAELNGVGDVSLLFCGHSRGAATANLAAAYANERTQGLSPLAPLENIYCYTFATPTVTPVAHAHEALYDNIFNIMNPSDLVPRLPLESWGYRRYGRDFYLPGAGDAAFDEHYDEMRAAFEENVGAESPYVPEDRARVDVLVEELGRQVPTVDDLASVGGVASVMRDLLMDINVMQVLYSHYPNVYIAWMQVIDGDDLTPAM